METYVCHSQIVKEDWIEAQENSERCYEHTYYVFSSALTRRVFMLQLELQQIIVIIID